jgi:hypothetical protein
MQLNNQAPLEQLARFITAPARIAVFLWTRLFLLLLVLVASLMAAGWISRDVFHEQPQTEYAKLMNRSHIERKTSWKK